MGLRPLDVAVAGAGPAGLATALYLTRLGHRVVVHERFDEPKPLGSGLIMQPTGLAVLADLGLHQDIAALGAPLDRLTGTDARTGRMVLNVRYDALRGGQKGLGVHRAALFSVLHDAVVRAGIEIRTGITVAAIADRGGGKRLVATDGREYGPFDLVVDTLGAASPLRGPASRSDRPRPLRYGAIWGTLPWVDDGFDTRALLQRYRRASVMVGVLPIGRQMRGGPTLAALFWSLKVEDFAALEAAGVEAWKEQVRRLWPETGPHLDAITGFADLTLARYVHYTLNVPIGDGIAFVGDSAHSTSPQLGQGANMALLDARALFLSLKGATDLDDALDRYARLRRWHVRLFQALSYAFTPFYQSDSVMLPVIRDFLVAHIARIPPAPQALAAMVSGTLLSPLRRLELAPPPSLPEGYFGMSGQT